MKKNFASRMFAAKHFASGVFVGVGVDVVSVIVGCVAMSILYRPSGESAMYRPTGKATAYKPGQSVSSTGECG